MRTAKNHGQNFSSYDRMSNEVCSEQTQGNLQQSEPILKYHNIEKQSEEPVTVKQTEIRQGSDYGVISHTGYVELNTPSAITDKVGYREHNAASVQAFEYEVDSSVGDNGVIRVM